MFLGVVGGLLAFGFLGIFLGPTLLAIGYVLFQEWSGELQSADGDPGAASLVRPEAIEGSRPPASVSRIDPAA